MEKKDNVIVKVSLVDQVIEQIRQSIFNFEYKPGDKIDLKELSEKWGVSRTPLREAIRKLEAEGLITYKAQKGFMIRSIQPEEVEKLFVVRKNLESLAGSLACDYVTDGEIKEIENIHNKIITLPDKSDFSKIEDLRVLHQLNKDFHFKIYKASKNKFLIQVISYMWNISAVYIASTLSTPGRINKIIKEHGKILLSLKKKDKAGVQKAIKKHLDSSEKDIMRGYKKIQKMI
ncbi:MAG: hypothetical protein DRI28_05170 [Caldiserica bacterium]|nr:MAG: hypothetical protein DRI28_05170 [Caldisericota bacterium]